MDTQHCTFGGTLKNGEAFYFDGKGALGIEKDHMYLVDATPEEAAEIIGAHPNLKFLPSDIKRATSIQSPPMEGGDSWQST